MNSETARRSRTMVENMAVLSKILTFAIIVIMVLCSRFFGVIQGYPTFRLGRICVSGEPKFQKSFLSGEGSFNSLALKFGENNH